LFVSALLTASGAFGQQSADECADLDDDRERLECYDRFFSGRQDNQSDNAGAGTEAREAPAPRARSERAAASRSSPSRETRRSSRPEPEAEPESAEERFGLERDLVSIGSDDLSGTAVGDFGMWQRGQRVRLENGQVWEVVDYNRIFHKASNPEVTIKKGFLGSYYMHMDGLGKGIKVKRLK